MPSELTDEALVSLVQKGDKHAFDLLVEKYQFKLLKLISRYISEPSEALDVAQDTFIKAYSAMDKFRGESSFYTWLYRIAINTAKNHLVVNSRRMLEIDIDLVDIEQSLYKGNVKEYQTTERKLQSEDVEHVVYNLIDHLPKELRTVIMLREMDGLSYEEIAGVMACPVGTVRSRIFRARAELERKIRPILKNL